MGEPLTADQLARTNELIAYHSPISHRLSAERTSYSSQLIPVTPYILVACAETFTRYPEMMAAIDAALPAEEIGRRGRRPGSRVNTVHLWSIANFFLLGRKIFTQFDPGADDPRATATVLDFWERAALGFRGDGTRQAEDSGGTVAVYDDDVVGRLVESAEPLDDEGRQLVRSWNATLVNYLFLLNFDTRIGTGDTGPYDLDGGRTLLVRDYYELGPRRDWWSHVAAEQPYRHLVAGLVLEGVEGTITDFGSIRTDPEDYLDRLVAVSLFTTDGSDSGELRPVALDEMRQVMAVSRAAQAAHYRNVAAMTKDEMIRCGAHVYFTFLRPFADVAGVADELDWTVPRDLPPMVYDMIVAVGETLGDQDLGDQERPETYYLPIA